MYLCFVSVMSVFVGVCVAMKLSVTPCVTPCVALTVLSPVSAGYMEMSPQNLEQLEEVVEEVSPLEQLEEVVEQLEECESPTTLSDSAEIMEMERCWPHFVLAHCRRVLFMCWLGVSEPVLPRCLIVWFGTINLLLHSRHSRPSASSASLPAPVESSMSCLCAASMSQRRIVCCFVLSLCGVLSPEPVEALAIDCQKPAEVTPRTVLSDAYDQFKRADSPADSVAATQRVLEARANLSKNDPKEDSAGTISTEELSPVGEGASGTFQSHSPGTAKIQTDFSVADVSHFRCHTLAVSLSICHSRCLTLAVSLSLSHSYCFTLAVSLSLSLSLSHSRCLTLTLLSHVQWLRVLCAQGDEQGRWLDNKWPMKSW